MNELIPTAGTNESAKNSKEYVVDAFDTHWIKFVRIFFILTILSILAISLHIAAGTNVLFTAALWPKILLLVSLAVSLFIIHWFFHRLMSCSLEDIIITNKRFIYLEARLWSRDEMHEISLNQIKAVESQKSGFIENIFRYGHISFDTGGSDMTARTFYRIPHPDRKAKIITDLLRTTSI